MQGARDTVISISRGLSPDFADTGGYNQQICMGARDTLVSISRGLGPTNSFSGEVFTTDSDIVVLAGWTGNWRGGVAGDGLSADALRKNKYNPLIAGLFFYTGRITQNNAWRQSSSHWTTIALSHMWGADQLTNTINFPFPSAPPA